MPLDADILPVSFNLTSEIQTKINHKTKPIGALGQLESLALRIGLILNTSSPSLNRPTILIFAGDHGIVASGVSAYPQSVTAQMVQNFLTGGAAISVFARQHQLELLIVDAGVNAEIAHGEADLSSALYHNRSHFINAKIAKGTRSFLSERAMSEQDCLKALASGMKLVAQQFEKGCNCIGFGEMGIGNTSSAALLMHRLTGIPLSNCVGSGAGLNDHQVLVKLAILQQASDFHSNVVAPLDVLATFGGFEIAMMTGAYLKAAELGIVILVDGFIASAAILVASKLKPNVLDYCVFSHVSSEHGHQALITFLNAQPLLSLGLRLGEGSGIALAYPLIQSAVLFLNEMASFAEAGVDQKIDA